MSRLSMFRVKEEIKREYFGWEVVIPAGHPAQYIYGMYVLMDVEKVAPMVERDGKMVSATTWLIDAAHHYINLDKSDVVISPYSPFYLEEADSIREKYPIGCVLKVIVPGRDGAITMHTDVVVKGYSFDGVYSECDTNPENKALVITRFDRQYYLPLYKVAGNAFTDMGRAIMIAKGGQVLCDLFVKHSDWDSENGDYKHMVAHRIREVMAEAEAQVALQNKNLETFITTIVGA